MRWIHAWIIVLKGTFSSRILVFLNSIDIGRLAMKVTNLEKNMPVEEEKRDIFLFVSCSDSTSFLSKLKFGKQVLKFERFVTRIELNIDRVWRLTPWLTWQCCKITRPRSIRFSYDEIQKYSYVCMKIYEIFRRIRGVICSPSCSLTSKLVINLCYTK